MRTGPAPALQISQQAVFGSASSSGVTASVILVLQTCKLVRFSGAGTVVTVPSTRPPSGLTTRLSEWVGHRDPVSRKQQVHSSLPYHSILRNCHLY